MIDKAKRTARMFIVISCPRPIVPGSQRNHQQCSARLGTSYCADSCGRQRHTRVHVFLEDLRSYEYRHWRGRLNDMTAPVRRALHAARNIASIRSGSTRIVNRNPGGRPAKNSSMCEWKAGLKSRFAFRMPTRVPITRAMTSMKTFSMNVEEPSRPTIASLTLPAEC